MSHPTVNSIVNDPEIAKLNSEIKKILDTLTAYYRMVDNTASELDGIQYSMSYHEAELATAKEQYEEALHDACHNKRCASNLTSCADYLKCASDCHHNQEVLAKLQEQITEVTERKTKVQKLISNYEKQLELKESINNKIKYIY